jgi:hypothetical protein
MLAELQLETPPDEDSALAGARNRAAPIIRSVQMSASSLTQQELIDKNELRRRLNLPSVRMVEQLMRKRKIPYLRLGHRTVRFSWPKVLAALDRFDHRAIGQ